MAEYRTRAELRRRVTAGTTDARDVEVLLESLGYAEAVLRAYADAGLGVPGSHVDNDARLALERLSERLPETHDNPWRDPNGDPWK